MLTLQSLARWLVTVPYRPDPTLRTFVARAQTRENAEAQVTVAVLDAAEAARFFGVPLARRGIQPVHLRIVNRSNRPLRLRLVNIDPNYFPPQEAAAVNHFSIAKRLSAFGVIGWLFLPLLLLMPFKLVSAYRANQRIDDMFRSEALPVRPIPAGGVSEGFVFTAVDVGTKVVRISLRTASDLLETGRIDPAAGGDASDFTFTIPVPGIAADYLHKDFAAMALRDTPVECDIPELAKHLAAMPAATTNAKHSRGGDPVNLVVVGEFQTLLDSFSSRWDESEVITLATCWKTTKAFFLGSPYRYSPVSPLYMFGRSQDIALQRSRHSINQRLHLRLWLTPLRYQQSSVWVGQVSRDIGVRVTTKTWNLTTHRVDPDVDEARDYVIEDLFQAGRIKAAAFVGGVGACDRLEPRRNLTGDPYYTDGKRAVIQLAAARTV